MRATLRERHGRCDDGSDERGFTLIELMVVVLIIGILIAMALPTYLGARARAADRAIQTDMRSGLAAALAYYAEYTDWTGFDAATATAEEGILDWVDAGPPSWGEIAIVVHANQDLLLAGLSKSGEFFCVAQVYYSPATIHGRGATFAAIDTVAECDAAPDW